MDSAPHIFLKTIEHRWVGEESLLLDIYEVMDVFKNNLKHGRSYRVMHMSLFSVAGHENNAHCIVAAVNHLAATFFTLTGHSVSGRMNEFLAVSCSVM